MIHRPSRRNLRVREETEESTSRSELADSSEADEEETKLDLGGEMPDESEDPDEVVGPIHPRKNQDIRAKYKEITYMTNAEGRRIIEAATLEQLISAFAEETQGSLFCILRLSFLIFNVFSALTVTFCSLPPGRVTSAAHSGFSSPCSVFRCAIFVFLFSARCFCGLSAPGLSLIRSGSVSQFLFRLLARHGFYPAVSACS